jgi:hypothetical protein
MPSLTINFNHDLNVSVQKGDTIYTSIIANGQAGVNQPNLSGASTKPFPIGIVTAVGPGNAITIETSGYLPTPTITSSHYFFFSKDPVVNTSGIIGYFAETEYRNYSSSKAEMFATAVDYVESSK